MASNRADKRSEVKLGYQSGKKVEIEKRCFLLLCGDHQQNPLFLQTLIRVNAFKEPREVFKPIF